jgi:hypothetical protein
MTFAVVILNYNLPGYTNKLVDQLSKFKNVDTFVVDNCSTVRKPRLITHQLAKNVGYSGGYNHFLDWADEKGFKWDLLFLANNDIEIISDNLFEEIEAVYKKIPDIGCISPSIVGQSHTHMQHDSKSDQQYKEVPFLESMFLGVSRAMWSMYPRLEHAKVGWGLDLKMGYIARQHNLKNILVNSVKIYHFGQTTVREAKDAMTLGEFSNEGSAEMGRILAGLDPNKLWNL